MAPPPPGEGLGGGPQSSLQVSVTGKYVIQRPEGVNVPTPPCDTEQSAFSE